jgi:PAS domain S-box-containing protein
LAAYLTPLERAFATLHEAHAALLERQRALEQLPEVFLEGIPAIIYVAPWQGQPGEMLYVSPQAEALLGFAAPDWIAKPQLWLEQMEPDDREDALAERRAGETQRTAYVSEYRLRSRDGRCVWIHDEARIVADEQGQPQFWQGVMLEISERKAAEQRATFAERARLARELHDSVTQTLLAVNMHVRTLTKLWHLDPALAAAQVLEIERLTQTALAELRVLLLEMRPAELARTPLPRLLEQLATAMRGRGSTAIEVVAEPTPALAPDVQIALYRIAQEALNNVVKHSRAQVCQVRLWQSKSELRLTVTDDGIGFEPMRVPGGHLGILGLHERAATIGAHLAIRSAPGKGAQVEVSWPLPLSTASNQADLAMDTQREQEEAGDADISAAENRERP